MYNKHVQILKQCEKEPATLEGIMKTMKLSKEEVEELINEGFLDFIDYDPEEFAKNQEFMISPQGQDYLQHHRRKHRRLWIPLAVIGGLSVAALTVSTVFYLKNGKHFKFK